MVISVNNAENIKDVNLNDNRWLCIMNDDDILFELIISKNNLIKALQYKGNSICHTFDENYNYDCEKLLAWETHGKLYQDKLQYLFDNNNSIYCFYYELHSVTVRFKHHGGQLAIEYEDYENHDTGLGTFITTKFSKSDTNMIKNVLLNFLFK